MLCFVRIKQPVRKRVANRTCGLILTRECEVSTHSRDTIIPAFVRFGHTVNLKNDLIRCNLVSACLSEFVSVINACAVYLSGVNS